MGVIVLQPFANKYSLRQLEVEFNIDIDKFSRKDKDKYLFKNKGKIKKALDAKLKERLNG